MENNKYIPKRSLFTSSFSSLTNSTTPAVNSAYDPDYGLTDWFSDMTSAFYRSLLQGEMEESLDIIAKAQQDKNDAQAYKEYLELTAEMTDDELEIFKNSEDYKFYSDKLESLRKNGMWTNNNEPTLLDLDQIIQQSDSDISEAYKNYSIDREQYLSSIRNNDISQYYTSKSNEEVMNFGNLFFKMPATMGTSNTSAGWQAISMLGAMAGSKVGTWLGGIGGGFFGPGGAAAGAVAGNVLGSALGSLPGNIMARKGESHMEAFAGIKQRALDELAKQGVDTSGVIQAVKDQYKQAGIDTYGMTDDMLLSEAMTNPDIRSGNKLFDEIVSESYKGSRRLYERNMALGAGEVLSDMSYFIPLSKWATNGLKSVHNGIARGLTKRALAGTQVARKSLDTAIGNITKKVHWDFWKNGLVGTGIRSLIEGSEEGTQGMWTDEFIKGMYDDEYANDSFLDALGSGQIVEDIAESTLKRGRSLLAAFTPFDPIYSDDQQLLEQIVSGMMLPLTSPQAVIGGASNFYDYVKLVQASKQFEQLYSNALLEHEQFDRIVALNKMLREEKISFDQYQNIMDNIAEQLKSGKYDTSTLSEDGLTQMSNDDIDKFVAAQKLSHKILSGILKKYKKIADSFGLSDEDADYYYALKFRARNGKVNTGNQLIQSNLQLLQLTSRLIESDEFSEAVARELGDKIVSKSGDALKPLMARLAVLNRQIEILDVQLAKEITTALFQSALTERAGSIETNVLTLANAANSSLNVKDKLVKLRRELIENINKLYDAAEMDKHSEWLFENFDGVSEDQVEELNKLLQKTNSQLVTADMYKIADESLSNDKQATIDKITAAKNRIRRQHVLADAADAAAREVAPTSAQSHQASSSETLDEQINIMRGEIQTEVDQFDSALSNIPATHPMYRLAQTLRRGIALADTAESKAAFIQNRAESLSKYYDKESAREDATEEEKNLAKQLRDHAKTIATRYQNINNAVVESKARKQVHNPRFDNHSTVYTDEAGNRYQFSMQNARYTEEGGLELQMFNATEHDRRRRETEETLKRIETQRKEIDKRLRQAIAATEREEQEKLDSEVFTSDLIADIQEEYTERLNRLRRDRDAEQEQLNSLEDSLKKSLNAGIQYETVNVNLQRDFLNSLKHTDNKGNVKEFKTHLDKLVKDVDKAIEKHKLNRQDYKDTQYHEGDVVIDNTSATDKMKSLTDMVENAEDRALRVHAYPLRNTDGAKSQTKLGNPHFRAEYWRGYIYMPYNDVADLIESFSKNLKGSTEQERKDELNAKLVFESGGKKYNRKNAVIAFHELAKALASSRITNKQATDFINALIEGKDIEVGKLKFTKSQWENLVAALPVTQVLYQPRAGYAREVLPDLGSMKKTEHNTEAETKHREELIANLVLSYNPDVVKNASEAELDSIAAFDSKAEDKHAAKRNNGVIVRPGMVVVVSSAFNQKVVTTADTSDSVFLDETGNELTDRELREQYENSAMAAQANIDLNLLADILVSLGYGEPFDVAAALHAIDSKTNQSGLYTLTLGALKYGDGYIKQETFLLNYVKPVLGLAKTTGNKKAAANLRAKGILNAFRNFVPQSFRSYRDVQFETGNTPSVEVTVNDALLNFYGSKIKVSYNGEELLFQPKTQRGSKEYREEAASIRDSAYVSRVSRLMGTLEEVLTKSTSADQFWQEITDLGFTFDGGRINAEEVLKEYFNNRKFQLLKTPTNIVNAITLGKSTPLNDDVNYDQFRTKTAVVQSNLNEVDSLGLIKNKAGEYVFSIEKWRRKTDDESAEAANEEVDKKLLEFAVSRTEVENDRKAYKATLKAINYKDKNLLSDLFNSLIESYSEEEQNSIREQFKTTKQDLSKLVDKVVDDKIAALDAQEQAYIEQQEAEALKEIEEAVIEDFSDRMSSPLVFVVGGPAARGADKGSAIYVDKYGNKHVMKNVPATPGSIYLLLPKLLHPNGVRALMKLNPKSFNDSMINVLLTLFSTGIQTGFDSSINDIPGMSGDYTIEELLNELIFMGKDAVLNHPTQHNYDHLLYIENGVVHYGNSVDESGFILDNTPESREHFAKWLAQYKTFRIDREKLQKPGYRYKKAVSISDGTNVIYSHEADQLYTTHVIEAGLLTTSLNPNEGERIFQNMSTYSNYVRTARYQSSANASNKKSAVSREESAKKKTAKSDKLLPEIGSWPKGTKVKNVTDEELIEYRVLIIQQLNAFLEPYRASEEWDDDVATTRVHIKGIKGGKKRAQQNAEIEFDDNKLVKTITPTFLTTVVDRIVNGGDSAVQIVFGEFVQDGIVPNRTPLIVKLKKPSAPAALSATLAETLPATQQPATLNTTDPFVVPENSELLLNTGLSQFPILKIPAGNNIVEYINSHPQLNLVIRRRLVKQVTDAVNNNSLTFIKLTSTQPATPTAQTVANTQNATEDNNMNATGLLMGSFLTPAAKPAGLQNKPTAAKFEDVAISSDVVTAAITWINLNGNTNAKANANATDEEKRKVAAVKGATDAHSRLKEALLNNDVVEFVKQAKVIIGYHLVHTYGVNMAQVAQKLGSDDTAFRLVYQQMSVSKANFGSLVSFFDDCVEKEDYDVALTRVRRILGDNFDFDVLPEEQLAWDYVRGAEIFVFGYTTAAGLHILKNAGKVVKRVGEHEAFHRVSLFLLSQRDREKMYQDARNRHGLTDYTDQEVEEFLADEFAKFVVNASEHNQGNFYEKNPIKRAFLKLIDGIRRNLNKIFKTSWIKHYRNIDELFQDMYSGRYAYAQATKNNKLLFNELYRGNSAFSGIVGHSGAVLATNAKQFTTIEKNLIAKLFTVSGTLSQYFGVEGFKYNVLRDHIAEQVKFYELAMNTLSEDFSKLDEFLQASRIYNVYKGILDNFNEWLDYISRKVNKEFKLHKVTQADANAQLEDSTEDFDDGAKQKDNPANFNSGDYNRESFKENLYDTTSMSTKFLLWLVTESEKFDADGMLQYADTRSLWFNIIYDLQGVRSFDDALSRLTALSKRKDFENAEYYSQIVGLLQSASPNVQKAFFSDIARLYNTFINADYVQEIQELTKEQKEKGQVAVTTIVGALKNSNAETAAANNIKTWRSNIREVLSVFVTEVAAISKTVDKTAYRTKLVNKLAKATDAANLAGKNGASDLAAALQEVFNIEINVTTLRKYINALKPSDPKLTAFSKELKSQLLATWPITIQEATIEKTILEKMVGQKSILRAISDFSASKEVSVKNATTRGAAGGKLYVISAYDYISRVFTQFIRDNNSETEEGSSVEGWLNKLSRNPYSQNSVWLKAFRSFGKAFPVKIFTNSATVVDGDVFESRGTMELSPREDMLNKFTGILSGYHIIPALANKAKFYWLKGFAEMNVDDVVTVLSNGWCMPTDRKNSSLDHFIGYLADEFLAIANAHKTRDNFISELNRITGGKRVGNKTEPWSIESFSKLSAEEQEEIKRKYDVGAIFGTLVANYHYKDGKPQFVRNSEGKVIMRAGGIDLTNGNGYQSRHFGRMLAGLRLTDKQIQELTGNDANTIARNMAQEYKDQVSRILLKNIALTINSFIDNGLIIGLKIDITHSDFGSGTFAKIRIINRFLPKNVILENKQINPNPDNNVDGIITPKMLLQAIAMYTVNGMQDVMEFEKLVSGDIAFFKDITDVNKRYGALTSTIQLNDKTGTISANESNMFLGVTDRLYDSPIYNTITFNTTIVSNLRDYKKYVTDFLGDSSLFDESNFNKDKKEKGFTVKLDPSKLLDEHGNFTSKAKKGILVNLYIQHRQNGSSIALDASGNPLSDKQLAEVIINNFNTRFDGYLNIDPTDAQTWVSAEMYRQLRQRVGKWTDHDEACYNLMENFDRIDLLSKSHYIELGNICVELNIPDGVEGLKRQFEKWKSGDRQKMNEYKGFILNVCRNFDATSLKYVYYGNTAERVDDMFVPVYDKLSASPIFKIFAEGHQMEDVYNFITDKQIDMVKMNSAVKVGGVPSAEALDVDGNFNRDVLEHSPIQQQYFDQFGKQLNTDPHHTTTATLLTQFMKIAVMNIKTGKNYKVNGISIKGNKLLKVYQNILDELTVRGYHKFMEEFGVTVKDGKYSVDKTKFMRALHNMAETQDLPVETLQALTTDNGEFTIHPAALPNINWIQSRLISKMDKTVIKTVTPGQPLFQVASFGYDNLHDTKLHADSHLSACNERGCMEVKLSINLFADVLEAAGLKYDNFEVQRKFILENKDLLALAYRVPTQGQNSTIPIEIVDVLPSQRGAIIMFPADITAKTGSDFDIDKMFLARYNYIVDKPNENDKRTWKLKKVEYDTDEIIGKLESGNAEEIESKQLQNFLLDIYLSILTSPLHKLEAITPLDVTTAPLKDIKGRIEEITGSGDSSVPADLWFLSPTFQTAQKVKNSGSDNGIGPMALNNVFRFFIQMSNLRMRPNAYLQSLGLGEMNRIYDRNGNDILDSTSALINAHVDAVKDNYIGRMNVNTHTFDVTSFLISCGMGNDVYWFLGQPALKELSSNYIDLKEGQLGVSPEERLGSVYLSLTLFKYAEMAGIDIDEALGISEKASAEEMTQAYMEAVLKKLHLDGSKMSDKEYALQQIRYINTFRYIKDLAQNYRDALSGAQIDTAKYGITANEILSFIQSHDNFVSDYNIAFENPNALFDDTFLGSKYELGVLGMFNAFNGVIFEFAPVHKNNLDKLSHQMGVYGRFSKNFTRRIGVRLKTVMLQGFFNGWLKQRFPGTDTPLKSLLIGEQSVLARYANIKAKAFVTGEGEALFDVINNIMQFGKAPSFMLIKTIIRENQYMKNNVQLAWSELLESADEDIRQWAEDLMVYMFYITGGTDSNASSAIKTTLFDLVPPQYLANLRIGDFSYNQYMSEIMEQHMTAQDAISPEVLLDQAMLLSAKFDDDIFPTIDTSKSKGLYSTTFVGDGKQFAIIRKGAFRLLNFKTGLYSPYVRIKDSQTGQMLVYKLCNLQFSKSKNGNVFTNPVYTRMPNLGYRNLARAVYSVRADGFVDGDGKIQSLLNNNENLFTSIQQLLRSRNTKLDSKYASAFGISQKEDKESVTFSNVPIEFNQNTTFDQLANENGELPAQFASSRWTPPYATYAAIDSADHVILVYSADSGAVQDLVDYAQYRNKPFTVVNPEGKGKLNIDGIITILGTDDVDVLKDVMSRLPKSTEYVASSEFGTGLGYMIERGEVKGFTYYPGQKPKNSQQGVISQKRYTRETAKADNAGLYIFTDNTDRNSGSELISASSWYAKKYGRNKHHPGETTAQIRGLQNAYPVSTQRYFNDSAKGATGRWSDADIDEFKLIIDDEFEDIFNAWDSGKYTHIVLPTGDGFFNAPISQITQLRTPKLYQYLQQKVLELKAYVGDDVNDDLNQNQSIVDQHLNNKGERPSDKC